MFILGRGERGNSDSPESRRGLRICKEKKKKHSLEYLWFLTRSSAQPETRFISRLWPSDLPNQHSDSLRTGSWCRVEIFTIFTENDGRCIVLSSVNVSFLGCIKRGETCVCVLFNSATS